MVNTPTVMTLKAPAVKAKFEEVLGKKANGFVSSMLSVVTNNKLLEKADPNSIMTAAMKAATLDLPIEPSLGFAYILPYGNNAQFQIGYKGLIQLALRSGQITGLNSGVVYESQFVSYDPLFEELELDFSKEQGDVIKGYFASMKLAGGFKKVVFWTTEQVVKHGKRFSKSYNSGPWKSDFDAMAQKTVLKSMISKYAPLSTEMQMAIVADNETETVAPIKDVSDDFVLQIEDGSGSPQNSSDSILSDSEVNISESSETLSEVKPDTKSEVLEEFQDELIPIPGKKSK
ncbi:MAG: recombinase RecT [Streptococcaceae bacterium]|jgi:recombination protein RecT|nr:recombinase RecT [Streptococcaceae bacterium]